MQLHDENAKGFSCSECDYKSTRDDKLKRHMLSHKMLMRRTKFNNILNKKN